MAGGLPTLIRGDRHNQDGASAKASPAPKRVGSHPALVACAMKRGGNRSLFIAQHFKIQDASEFDRMRVKPAGRTTGGAGVETPSGSSANDFNRFHEGVQ